MLGIAFKEWAVICRALATEQQSLIIRKGGIAEVGGVFTPEHRRFWLYPTHFHEQQQKGVKASAAALLEQAERDRSPNGTLRFANYVDVSDVFFVDRLETALSLDDLHIWSADTMTQRFHYRSPGLYVLPVRVWETQSIEVPEHPAYAGCKSWVKLDRALADDGRPVLNDDEHDLKIQQLRERLTMSS